MNHLERCQCLHLIPNMLVDLKKSFSDEANSLLKGNRYQENATFSPSHSLQLALVQGHYLVTKVILSKALTSCYDCLYQESSLSWHLTGAGCRKPLHPDSQTEHACIHSCAEEFSHQKLSVSITVDGLGRVRESLLSLDVSTKSTTWNEADFILDCSHIYRIWQNSDSAFLIVVFYFHASQLPPLLSSSKEFLPNLASLSQSVVAMCAWLTACCSLPSLHRYHAVL